VAFGPIVCAPENREGLFVGLLAELNDDWELTRRFRVESFNKTAAELEFEFKNCCCELLAVLLVLLLSKAAMLLVAEVSAAILLAPVLAELGLARTLDKRLFKSMF